MVRTCGISGGNLNVPARNAIAKQSMELSTSTPAEFSLFVRGEIGKWGKVIRAIGLKVE